MFGGRSAPLWGEKRWPSAWCGRVGGGPVGQVICQRNSVGPDSGWRLSRLHHESTSSLERGESETWGLGPGPTRLHQIFSSWHAKVQKVAKKSKNADILVDFPDISSKTVTIS